MTRTEACVAPPVIPVIEDDADLREALELLLGAYGFAPRGYADVEAFLADATLPSPACIVTDVRLGAGLDGVALIARLRQRGSTVPVVVMTGHANVELAVRAMRTGALDFVEKPFEHERLVAAVQEGVAMGNAAPPSAQAAREKVALLTPREREVLASLVSGNPNKLVAHELGISARTVAAYRASIMDKLDVRSFAEAVRLAVAAGMTTDLP
jgi:two-component system response regulator FixJ